MNCSLLIYYLHNTLEEVLNVGADCSDRCQLLLLSKPLLYFDGLFVHHVNVDCQVLEGLGQSAPGSLDCDSPGLHRRLHALGHLDQLKGVQLLHRGYF